MKEPRSSVGAIVRLGILLLLAVGLFALWRWTPLGDLLEPSKLIAWGQQWKRHPAAPFLTMGGFGFMCVLMVPVTPMILAVSAVFDVPFNVLYALGGCILGSIPTFWIGRWLGKDAVERLAKGRAKRFNHLLERHGLVACVAVRFLPAPFTLVNMLAGATEIRFRDFIIGTSIGMAFSVTGIAVLGTQLVKVIQNPTPKSIVILASVAVGVVLLGLGLRRWAQHQADRVATPPEDPAPDDPSR